MPLLIQNKSLLGGGDLIMSFIKAGPLMKEECVRLNQEKVDALQGQAEVTTAGNLPAKYLLFMRLDHDG